MKPYFVACYDENKSIGCYHEINSDCECDCHSKTTLHSKEKVQN